MTSKAIAAFEDFSRASSSEELSEQAGKTVQRLKNRTAEKSMAIAKFYESQKHYESAVIYYQEVLDKLPDSSSASEARKKIEEFCKEMG